ARTPGISGNACWNVPNDVAYRGKTQRILRRLRWDRCLGAAPQTAAAGASGDPDFMALLLPARRYAGAPTGIRSSLPVTQGFPEQFLHICRADRRGGIVEQPLLGDRSFRQRVQIAFGVADGADSVRHAGLLHERDDPVGQDVAG